MLAGPSHPTLSDVFANLELAPQSERLLRHPKRDLLGTRICLAPDEGEGYWEFTRIRDEIYVVVANFAYKEPRYELVPATACAILLQDLRRHDPRHSTAPSRCVGTGRRCSYGRSRRGVDISEWTAPCTRERYVTISVRPEFLADHLLSSGVEASGRLQPFVSAGREKIDYCQLPLTPLMFEVAGKLIDNQCAGTLGLVLTEALALELLCSAAESLYGLSDAPREEYSERELRCLHAARSILMRQFAPAPTISKLARSVGIAESTLTKGFKCIFGQTIFDFSLHCRMQHAMTMICDRRWSVSKPARRLATPTLLRSPRPFAAISACVPWTYAA